MLRRLVASLCLTACGGFLAVSGDDETDNGTPPSPSADASGGEDGASEDSGPDGNGEAGQAAETGADAAIEATAPAVWTCSNAAPQGPYATDQMCIQSRATVCATAVTPSSACTMGEPGRKSCTNCAEDGTTPGQFFFSTSSCQCLAAN